MLVYVRAMNIFCTHFIIIIYNIPAPWSHELVDNEHSEFSQVATIYHRNSCHHSYIFNNINIIMFIFVRVESQRVENSFVHDFETPFSISVESHRK